MTEDLTIDRKIIGDVYQPRGWGAQIDATEFLARLDAVLAFDEVEYVQWSQYTPYFNDGDECVFSVREIYVKIRGVDSGGDYDNGLYSYYDLEHVAPVENANQISKALNAIEKPWGSINEVCLRNFGDHAIVKATREGFEVETYEHE